jgi:hypothetical protein
MFVHRVITSAENTRHSQDRTSDRGHGSTDVDVGCFVVGDLRFDGYGSRVLDVELVLHDVRNGQLVRLLRRAAALMASDIVGQCLYESRERGHQDM